MPEKIFAADTESFDLNPFHSLTMLQLYDGAIAYAFNWGVINDPRVKPLVQRLLNHPNARFVWHNVKHDAKMVKHWLGVSVDERSVDTMCLALGTTEKARQVGLKYRSRQDLDAPFYEEGLEEWLDTDKKKWNFGHIRPDVLAEYGCKDVFYTYGLLPVLSKRVTKEGTWKAVKEILLPAQAAFADIEYQGMRCDVEYARTTSAEWLPKIEEAIKNVQDYAASVGFPRPDSGIGRRYKVICECVPEEHHGLLDGLRVLSYAKRLRESGATLDTCERCSDKRYRTEVDVTLNVNSSEQMQHLCYDILNMKGLPHEPKNTTNKDFWKYNGNHPLAKLVAEYKELQYLRRNFLEGMQKFVAEDGKVHPNFLLFGTKTGRIAIHDPAMQTVPKYSQNSKAVKRLFMADDDEHLIVNIDYKSLEMFIAHHLTGDPVLLENLTGEWDVHTALAAEVYNKPASEVTPTERQSVKSVNFGAGYGISGFKLSLDPAMEAATGGDPDKAQEFLDTFWNMYSTWKMCCDEWREQAHSQFFLTTELGRKRRWNLITKDNYNKVNNQAVNFPGQSMASDLCLSSLIKVHWGLQERGWGRIILSVHDSLVANVRKEFIHEAIAYMCETMTTPPFESDTPFAVDVELGPTYGDLEPYDPAADYS